MTMREQEVGVFDFVLLDEITLEKFMQNLRKRYVCVLQHTGVVYFLPTLFPLLLFLFFQHRKISKLVKMKNEEKKLCAD